MRLGRLLGAGRGAPIIVAGDRSETSPSNPGSSARKSCHRGSEEAPHASHPVCQHPCRGTKTQASRTTEGTGDRDTRARISSIWTSPVFETKNITPLTLVLVIYVGWENFMTLGPF